MEPENQFGAGQTETLIDARQHPRLKLDLDVKIYSRTSSRVMGRTVDISETGLAALLKIEIPLDQVALLEFTLPLGLVFGSGAGPRKERLSIWLPVRRAGL